MAVTTTQTIDSEGIDTRIALVYRRDDGIICAQTKDNVEITLVGSKECYEAVKSLANGEKSHLLSLTGSGATITDKARDFWVAKKKGNPVIAEAVVAKSLAHKLIVNFLVKFFNPGRPMKVFTNEPEAVKWLQKNVVE